MDARILTSKTNTNIAVDGVSGGYRNNNCKGLREKLWRAREKYKKVYEILSGRIVGQEKACILSIAALLSGSHIMFTGPPGTGKTTLFRTLAASFGGGFAWAQFNAMMTPQDLVGAEVYIDGEFRLYPGYFGEQVHIFLADEINRANPRAQSAMLGPVQEREWKPGPNVHTLRLANPFLLVASRNPFEEEETFGTPYAMDDRFAMELVISHPPAQAFKNLAIARWELSEDEKLELERIEPVMGPDDILSDRLLIDRWNKCVNASRKNFSKWSAESFILSIYDWLREAYQKKRYPLENAVSARFIKHAVHISRVLAFLVPDKDCPFVPTTAHVAAVLHELLRLRILLSRGLNIRESYEEKKKLVKEALQETLRQSGIWRRMLEDEFEWDMI